MAKIQEPLIQNSRLIDDKLIEIGMMSNPRQLINVDGVKDDSIAPILPLDKPLERLLRLELPEAHLAIAECLWSAESTIDAVSLLSTLAENRLTEYEGVGSIDSREESRGKRGESTWEVGGNGPRGGSKEIDTDSTSENGGETETRISSSNRPIGWRAEHTSTSAIKVVELRVGRVIACSAHPDADFLQISVVDLGSSSDTGTVTGTVTSSVLPSIDSISTPITEDTTTESVNNSSGNDSKVVDFLEKSAVSEKVVSEDGSLIKRNTRTIVTSKSLIDGYKEGLLNKKVIVLCNIKPRRFMNVSSEAMILFSHNNETNEYGAILAPESAPEGMLVTFPGYKSNPLPVGNKVAKSWQILQTEEAFYVNNNGIACFDPRPKTMRMKEQKEELVNNNLLLLSQVQNNDDNNNVNQVLPLVSDSDLMITIIKEEVSSKLPRYDKSTYKIVPFICGRNTYINSNHLNNRIKSDVTSNNNSNFSNLVSPSTKEKDVEFDYESNDCYLCKSDVPGPLI